MMTAMDTMKNDSATGHLLSEISSTRVEMTQVVLFSIRWKKLTNIKLYQLSALDIIL